jgi:CRISPR-associated helicase Cas3
MQTKIKICSESLPICSHIFAKNKFKGFYPHQIKCFEIFEQNLKGSDVQVLLNASTGKGKTASIAIPTIQHRHNAIFIYPTNALIKSQEASIKEILGNYEKDDYEIQTLSAVDLDEKQIEWNTTRVNALTRILTPQIKKKIILTNPDIIFLIFEGIYNKKRHGKEYSGELLLALKEYDVIVFDEVHSYEDKELTNLLLLVRIFKEEYSIKNIFFLTATPFVGFKEIFEEKASITLEVINEWSSNGYQTIGNFIAVKEVEINVNKKEKRIVEQFLNKIRDHSDRTVICILESVVDALALVENLKPLFGEERVVDWTGLTPKYVKQDASFFEKLQRKMMIGTKAIELGIDTPCDYLSFEASDFSSFIQRFGRAGRTKSESEINYADVFLDEFHYERFVKLKDKNEFTRKDFESFVSEVFNSKGINKKFVESKYLAAQHFLILNQLLDEENVKKYMSSIHPHVEIDEVKKIAEIFKKVFQEEYLIFRLARSPAYIYLKGYHSGAFTSYDAIWCIKRFNWEIWKPLNEKYFLAILSQRRDPSSIRMKKEINYRINHDETPIFLELDVQKLKEHTMYPSDLLAYINPERVIQKAGEEYLIKAEAEVSNIRVEKKFPLKGIFCIVNENPMRYGFYSSTMRIRGTGSYLLYGEEALRFWIDRIE